MILTADNDVVEEVSREKLYWVRWPTNHPKPQEVLGWFYKAELDGMLKQFDRQLQTGKFTYVDKQELEDHGLVISPNLPILHSEGIVPHEFREEGMTPI